MNNEFFVKLGDGIKKYEPKFIPYEYKKRIIDSKSVPLGVVSCNYNCKLIYDKEVDIFIGLLPEGLNNEKSSVVNDYVAFGEIISPNKKDFGYILERTQEDLIKLLENKNIKLDNLNLNCELVAFYCNNEFEYIVKINV